MHKLLIFAFLAVIFIRGPGAASDPTAYACPESLPRIETEVNGHPLTLTVAATPEARECGISKRNGLPQNEGFLFVLPAPQPVAFWMKDTRIPIDIAFLDDAGRVLSIQQMVPLRTDVIYRSPQPVRYAIEVNQGWFARQGVGVGDVITLPLPVGLRID
ncbi:MAG: DUF192 domain-containing protein [Pseudomonadota bacterium]